MAKHKIAYAMSAAAVSLGSIFLAPLSVSADIAHCVAADGLMAEGQIMDASELEYVITNGIEAVKVANDFTISCQPTIMTTDFRLDLNGKTVNANAPWALDIETAGKTLTIEDTGEGGQIIFNDAGIWVEGGANLTINSGTISVPEGRGRGIVFRDGVFTLTGGVVSANNSTYTSGSNTFYYPTIVVLSDSSEATLNISGGTIDATNGTALSVSGVTVSMTDGEIHG